MNNIKIKAQKPVLQANIFVFIYFSTMKNLGNVLSIFSVVFATISIFEGT